MLRTDAATEIPLCVYAFPRLLSGRAPHWRILSLARHPIPVFLVFLVFLV
eukprot:COSAG01_NODE_5743_length_4062_cov_464.007318_4_plen_50_part_00